MTILSKKIYTNSEQETFSLGRSIGKVITPGVVIGFEGELGAGKTVFIKGILAGLGYEPRNVASASFVLVQEYKARFHVVHIDLYRLGDNIVIEELGWDDYCSKENIVLIEWVEKVKDILTVDVLVKINLLTENEKRLIEINAEDVKFLEGIII